MQNRDVERMIDSLKVVPPAPLPQYQGTQRPLSPRVEAMESYRSRADSSSLDSAGVMFESSGSITIFRGLMLGRRVTLQILQETPDVYAPLAIALDSSTPSVRTPVVLAASPQRNSGIIMADSPEFQRLMSSTPIPPGPLPVAVQPILVQDPNQPERKRGPCGLTTATYEGQAAYANSALPGAIRGLVEHKTPDLVKSHFKTIKGIASFDCTLVLLKVGKELERSDLDTQARANLRSAEHLAKEYCAVQDLFVFCGWEAWLKSAEDAAHADRFDENKPPEVDPCEYYLEKLSNWMVSHAAEVADCLERWLASSPLPPGSDVQELLGDAPELLRSTKKSLRRQGVARLVLLYEISMGHKL